MLKKRGQLTLFIILGIALMSVIFIVFFLFISDSDDGQISPVIRAIPKTQAQETIRSCVEPHLKDAIEKIEKQGGYTYNKLPSLVYRFRNISYLCHTPNYEDNCINLEPVLIGSTESEIESYLSPKIEDCFDNFLRTYSEYEVIKSNTIFETEILPQKITINLEKNIRIVDEGAEVKFEDFSFDLGSPLYTFLLMAIKLSNAETKCNCGQESCNSDYFEIDRLNRGFTTTRFTSSFGEKVYTIKYLSTGEEFSFGVRNCIERR